MFLKRIDAKSKDGKKRTYWALVKSVRTVRGPRHRVVSYLGELQAGEKSEWANLARIVNKRPIPHRPLFDTPESTEPVPETIEVRVRGARVERTRDFGSVYLALTLWRALELDKLLERIMPGGRGQIPGHIVATILSMARFCEPSSELHIADTWYERTSLDDLMGVADHAVNPDRLYRAHDHLLKHKDDIEKHLKERYPTLFDAQYDLLLYDVTSTYFEGEAKRNPQAMRGHSRDHRSDCKQVCIGLVVTQEGLQSLERRLDKAKKKPNRSQVERQIGRLLGKNSRAAGLFDIKVSKIDREGSSGFLKVTWTKKDEWREWTQLSEGCYLLRTNLVDWTAKDLWKTYIQLTQAESAFRTQKTELNLRPIWHHKEDRVQAHILFSFLAYAM